MKKIGNMLLLFLLSAMPYLVKAIRFLIKLFLIFLSITYLKNQGPEERHES